MPGQPGTPGPIGPEGPELRTRLNIPRQLTVPEGALDLKLADRRALEVIDPVGLRLPPDTPITDMGLTRAAVSSLTPAARNLTKGDLQAMADGRVTRKAAGLTVADIQSVRVAFGSGYDAGASPVAAVSCCCCTPCCCAAA